MKGKINSEYKKEKCCGESFINSRHFDEEKRLKDCGYWGSDYYFKDEVNYQLNPKYSHYFQLHMKIKEPLWVKVQREGREKWINWEKEQFRKQLIADYKSSVHSKKLRKELEALEEASLEDVYSKKSNKNNKK